MTRIIILEVTARIGVTDSVVESLLQSRLKLHTLVALHQVVECLHRLLGAVHEPVQGDLEAIS